MADVTPREHIYHGEATVLSANLRLPLEHDIEPQACAKLSPDGGYLSQTEQDYRLEGVLSYSSAYTQVAGHPGVKKGQGWTTLVTAVVENLNVLDVVTADRIVGQISTDHPLTGYTPHVSFLGTRFDNLRIAGHPVKLHLDLDVFGDRHVDDLPYTHNPAFLQKLKAQRDALQQHADLPVEVQRRYNQVPTGVAGAESVECSLVNQAGGSYPGRSFGHVIDVPNFGKIYLAALRLEQEPYTTETGTHIQTLFNLTMIELKLGCFADGTAAVSQTITNGHTKP